MSILYNAVGGSRSYGIAVPGSDTDVMRVESPRGEAEPGQDKVDLHPYSVSEFISDMSGPKPRWFFTQLLYPEAFLDETALSGYISENRDAIIEARLPLVYETLRRRADGLSHWGDRLYKTCPKRLAYSTLFYSILGNYAEGMPFARAHRPEGELHDLLIGMRLGQVPSEEAVARNTLERARAEKAAGFYRQAVRPEALREFEEIIRQEAKGEA